MTIDDLRRIEFPSLREEMLEVKKCQHQLIIFSIISAGAILSYVLTNVATLHNLSDFWPVLLFLLPMAIVIPFQYTVIDKAITINRICSYFKIVEEKLGKETPLQPIVWEAGCAQFRTLSQQLAPVAGANPTQGPNNFYKLGYVITCATSGASWLLTIFYYICWVESRTNISAEIVLLAAVTLVILLILRSLYVRLLQVLEGKYAILAMDVLWRQII